MVDGGKPEVGSRDEGKHTGRNDLLYVDGWVLLVLQRWTRSRNRPTATDEKTRKVFSVSVVISLVGTISGKSLKLLPPDVII